MAIDVKILDGAVRIAISGRFSFDLHRHFKNAYMPLLDNETVPVIEIELSKVDYLDSAALGMLILLHERASNAGKSVTLVNAIGYPAQVLETANFNKIFAITRAS